MLFLLTLLLSVLGACLASGTLALRFLTCVP